ncbi:unnamed protein product [Arabidopsis halleri]
MISLSRRFHHLHGCVARSAPLIANMGEQICDFFHQIEEFLHQIADGTYAMKKVLIQNKEQLELVREEIRVSSLFNHPNLLPLLDHAIISVKDGQEGAWKHEAFLLFPVHLDGTLLDNFTLMKAKKETLSTTDVLHIFRQGSCGLLQTATLNHVFETIRLVLFAMVFLFHFKGSS